MKRTKQTLVSLALTVLLAVAPVALAAASVSAADMAAVQISFSQALAITSDAYPDLRLFSLSLDDENGVLVYQAELFNPADGSNTAIGIDSVTGEMLIQSGDTDDVRDENEDDAGRENENDQNKQEMETENDSDAETGNAPDNAVLLHNAVLAVAQAQTLTLNANPGASVTEIELQDENGTPVFDVVFIDAGGQAKTVKIDAVTGAFLAEDMQSENE